MGNKATYSRNAEHTVRMAKAFGYNLDTELRGRVETVFDCMCEVDNYIDSLPEQDKKQAAGKVLHYLGGHNMPEIANAIGALPPLRQILQQFPINKQKRFVDAVIRIFACGKILHSTEDAQRFSFVRKVEAICSADLVLMCMGLAADNEKFARFYRHLAIGGNWMDSVTDFIEDKRKGEIKLPLGAAFTLLSKSICLIVPTVSAYPRKIDFFSMVTIHLAKKALGYINC